MQAHAVQRVQQRIRSADDQKQGEPRAIEWIAGPFAALVLQHNVSGDAPANFRPDASRAKASKCDASGGGAGGGSSSVSCGDAASGLAMLHAILTRGPFASSTQTHSRGRLPRHWGDWVAPHAALPPQWHNYASGGSGAWGSAPPITAASAWLGTLPIRRDGVASVRAALASQLDALATIAPTTQQSPAATTATDGDVWRPLDGGASSARHAIPALNAVVRWEEGSDTTWPAVAPRYGRVVAAAIAACMVRPALVPAVPFLAHFAVTAPLPLGPAGWEAAMRYARDHAPDAAIGILLAAARETAPTPLAASAPAAPLLWFGVHALASGGHLDAGVAVADAALAAAPLPTGGDVSATARTGSEPQPPGSTVLALASTALPALIALSKQAGRDAVTAALDRVLRTVVALRAGRTHTPATAAVPTT